MKEYQWRYLWVTGSIPGLERSPGVGNGNPLQDSFPENPMNKEAYGTVAPQSPITLCDGISKSRIRLSNWAQDTAASASPGWLWKRRISVPKHNPTYWITTCAYSINTISMCFASLVVQSVKDLTTIWKTWVGRIPWRRAWQPTHSSILAWRMPWTEEPGRLQSMGLQRVRYDWVTFTSLHHDINSKRQMYPNVCCHTIYNSQDVEAI